MAVKYTRKRKKYNPEKRTWEGKSYKKHGSSIRAMKEKETEKDES